MSNHQSPATVGKVVSFEKSARYWLRRAEHHRKRGEYHRAAALLRHAVALEPASGELRMEYAQTLRDMSCFEASNREAFGALALEPAGFVPFHIIGRNMLSLGREQEALDAFSHYLQKARTVPEAVMPWDEDDELFEIENLVEIQPCRSTARYEALVHIGSLRLARGDLEGTRKALSRAERQGRSDSRLNALYAMFYQALQKPGRALEHALISARKNPHNVPALCALASVRAQLGQRGLAAAAMLKAALYCRYPHQEQVFCFTASALNLPEIAVAMLRYNKRMNPDRLPTLYNLSIALLKQGHTEEPIAYLHRCRDLDPEDVTVQFVFRAMMDWKQRKLTQEEWLDEAAQLAFYPFLPPVAAKWLLETLTDALSHGLDSFSDALRKDGALYRSFLYAVSMPGSTMGWLLPPIATHMAESDRQAAERMLRDVLWQATQNGETKRYALSALIAFGAEPPYVIWQNGRIVQANPQASPVKPASVTQRLILSRIRASQRVVRDKRVVAHALTLLSRMDHRRRYAFAADVGHVWRDALVRHFSLYYGLVPPAHGGARLSPELQRRARVAFAQMCALMPLP